MSRLRAYAQLVRLPALPSALADIGLGALATASLNERWPTVAGLAFASACLYCAGMAWNDFFDVDQDRRERPDRPIPSGRIARAAAGRFAALLMLAGVAAALCADGWRTRDSGRLTFLSTGVALALVAAILLYDGCLKRTPLGPLSMGLCRSLNVLLGVSAAGALPAAESAHLAAIVGLYIVGVTWFARTEARQSYRAQLRAAATVMLLALGLALPLPLHRPPGTASIVFPFLLVTLGFLTAGPIRRAIARPAPGPVQAAVRRSLLGLIVLDTALATALAGDKGLMLLALLGPAIYLASKRWLYAT